MQIKEKKSERTRSQEIRYCLKAKKILDKYLPKYYAEDVALLANEKGIKYTIDQIRNVRSGRTPNKAIMELLIEVAILRKVASSNSKRKNDSLQTKPNYI